MHRVALAALISALPSLARAAPWEPGPALGEEPGLVAQDVELADLDHDGWVDVLLAHRTGETAGGPDTAQRSTLARNLDGQGFSTAFLTDAPTNARAVRTGDLDEDGALDVVLAGGFGEPSLVLRSSDGFATPHLVDPAPVNLGDLELGDIDGDGHLDLVGIDWGATPPHGAPGDPGGPLRIWRGDGLGGFAPAPAPEGPDDLVSWSFDLDLADLDNDHDLDLVVASRGPGHARLFQNDGTGLFAQVVVPALQPAMDKQLNAAITPVDLDLDGLLDLVTLQDGPGLGACGPIDGVEQCARSSSLLLKHAAGPYLGDPLGFWGVAANPPRLDFAALTLDADSDGTPDLLLSGLRQDQDDVNTRLLLNDGVHLTSAPQDPFPPLPGLARSFDLALADLDRDGREDIAVAVRDPAAPSLVLRGQPDAVALDTTPPQIGAHHEVIPDGVNFHAPLSLRLRAHDLKSETRWHDWRFDPQLAALNLIAGAKTLHGRRLPWLEYALGLADPEELAALPDSDPAKLLVPAVWYGESLWRVDFSVPYAGEASTTLTWRLCALDAADNRSCVGPFQVIVESPRGTCGDGVVQPWEQCDDALGGPCRLCALPCGNGVCDHDETAETCLEDCDPCDHDGTCDVTEDSKHCPDECYCGDGILSSGETPENCPEDSGYPDGCSSGTAQCSCADGVCEPGEELTCPEDCPTDESTGGESTGGESVTTGAPDVEGATTRPLPDDGGCRCSGATDLRGAPLLLLLALLRRRRT